MATFGTDRPPAAGDDFFALGGDSLLAVRLAARLREEGFPCRIRDVIEAGSFREMVARIHSAPAPVEPEPVAQMVSGPGLLPAQLRWLDGEIPDIDYFNLDILLRAPAELTSGRLEAAAKSLLLRHEALSTRYEEVGGAWIARPVRVDDSVVHRVVTQEPLPESDEAFAETMRRLHRSLSIEDGRVFRLVGLTSAGGEGRIFMLVHHLTADGLSMAVLVDDLELALRSAGGRPVDLGKASAQPRQLAAGLAAWTETREAAAQAEEWVALPWQELSGLPVDKSGAGRVDSNRTARRSLDRTDTQRLVGRLHTLGVNLQHAVLGSVLGQISAWSGSGAQGVDIYEHNRANEHAGHDLTTTVGYVQSTYPAVLRIPGARDLDSFFVNIQEQLDRLPAVHAGFDAIRYMGADPFGLRSLPRPEIRLNYRGALARLLERRGSLLVEAPESTGLNRSTLQTERYKLMIEGDIVDESLLVGIRYSSERYKSATVQALVDGAVDHLRRVAEAG